MNSQRCLDHFDVKILENYLSRTENNAAAVVKICQLLKKRIFHSNTNLQVAAVFPFYLCEMLKCINFEASTMTLLLGR